MSNEWLQRLDRHLDAARTDGRALTVGDLRALIDDAPGGPRGLPETIADLVVLLVATQTDHAITHAGRAIVAEPGKPLPADAMLRVEPLPSAAVWSAAVAMAQAVFGVNASPRVSAGEMAVLADKVTKAAANLVRPAADLLTALDVAARKVGLDDDGGDRLRSARAGDGLVRVLSETGIAPLAVVERLADAQIPTSAHAVAKTLSSAAAVARSLADTNWELLLLAGAEVVEPMRTLLQTDEFALGQSGYEVKRRALEKRATELIGGGGGGGGGGNGGGGGRTRLDATVRSRSELDKLVYETLSGLLD